MKIILITIDTLRADRVGCYGCPRETTPNIDRLASEGALFRHAFSPSTYTVPAHAAILTGRYPGGLSVFFSQLEGFNDSDRELALQEILSDRGYKTAAFLSSRVLRSGMGLTSGFGLYDVRTTSAEANRPEELIRSGEETNRVLFDWLGRNSGGDFFVWVHYFDVHGPYVNPEPFASMFRPEDYGPDPVPLDAVPEGEPGGIPDYQLLKVVKDESGASVDYEHDARSYFAQYDAGVRVADHEIGRLAGELKRLGIYDETAVVITADHGEAMGEDGVYFFHGLTATPDQAKVPLVFKLPGGARAGFVAEAPVSTVDITPTLLDLAGVDASGLGLDGEPLFAERPDDGRFVLSENEWQRAVIHGGRYLLREKDVIRDGFTYYFDSKDLCKGTRLFDSRTGLELTGETVPGALWDFSEALRRYADPREVTIRTSRIAINALESENDALRAGRDVLLGEKAALLDERVHLLEAADNLMGELKAARSEQAELTKTVESMVNSRSWRLTYPMRWVTAMLKGTKTG